MESRNDTLKASTSRLFIILGLISMVPVCLIIAIFFRASTSEKAPQYIVPHYLKENVLYVCELFHLKSSDEFCAKPDNQTVESFRTMLYRNFPPSSTSYKDIAPLLSELKSRSERSCWDGFNSPLVYLVDNCPPPEKCSTNYACVFDLPKMGGIQISFDQSTNLVGGYLIINPFGTEEYQKSVSYSDNAVK